MTEEERATFYKFICDFWNLMKSNFRADPNDDKYWAEWVQGISALSKKYDNHPAVLHTLLGYSDYLEHEGSGRERRKYGEI